jgi:hypothetical protein
MLLDLFCPSKTGRFPVPFSAHLRPILELQTKREANIMLIVLKRNCSSLEALALETMARIVLLLAVFIGSLIRTCHCDYYDLQERSVDWQTLKDTVDQVRNFYPFFNLVELEVKR